MAFFDWLGSELSGPWWRREPERAMRIAAVIGFNLLVGGAIFVPIWFLFTQ